MSGKGNKKVTETDNDMKVKLNDVIDTLDFVNLEHDAYYNPLKNEFFYSNIGEYTDLNEDELDELFENSIGLPTSYEIDEYSMMEEFIETIDDVKTYNQLQIAINGRGAFRRFKDTCINFKIIDDWYKFREEKYKEIAIDWCKENKIDFE